MKKLLLIPILFISTTIFSQAKFIEKVERKGDEVIIPYERYQLPNGLNIILHEDHSDPLVHVDVTYHVGSAREEIGKSGFAHFFEHMMFQGSDNVADEQHFKIITEAGGTLNGTTNRDRTNYFETVPKNQLEKMLWLEADRMGFLLDAVTQKKFEVQRATVKNERGQNYDNKPYGLVRETAAKNLYPYGHPYSWLTIGYIEDLNRVNVEDLKNFFLRWYGPNNAVITVGGDLDKAQTLQWIEKYYGSIPRGPEVEPVKLPTPKLEKDRYVSMMDNYAKLPMLSISLPSVPRYHNDEAALDCLAQILGGGKSSYMYQKLVKTQKALSASANHPTDELAGTFDIQLTVKAGVELAGMEQEIRKIIEEFAKTGPTDEQIERFNSSNEASSIYALNTVSGKVSQLASYFTFTGNANYIQESLKKNTSVTKEDVIRVFNQYVYKKPMLILSVLTKGSEKVAAASDNYTVNEVSEYNPDFGYDKLKYTKATDNFDRSVMPKAGENPVISIPKFEKKSVKGYLNEVKMISSQMNEIPVLSFQISTKGGRLLEQNNLEKVGITNLFTAMMNEDTEEMTAENINNELDKLGSSVNFYSSDDEFVFSVSCLTKNLMPTLKILDQRMYAPKFNEKTFDRIKNQTLERIKNNKNQASVLATLGMNKMFYGSESILAYPSYGTKESIEKISFTDIQNFYNEFISNEELRLTLVGDFDKKEKNKIFNTIKELPNKKIPDVKLPIAKTGNGEIVYILDVPNAAQSEFRVGYVTNLKYDATGEYYKAGLMNYPLGGAFNSRVNLNLREDKGWTYGARSNFSGDDYTGEYLFSSGIKADKTDSALFEVIREIKEFHKNGMNENELAFLKSAISQSEARKYETIGQQLGFFNNISKRNLSSTYTNDQNEILKNATTNELNKLASKYLDVNKFIIVIAGDKAKISSGIEKLGYSIVELDSDGNLKN
ncbi:MAG: insulinase family protein [Chitinophagaceae bacterium]|nr:insulinase family protein [Chitinophagaceae bacterium]